jgi:D-glucuronyl C5-epimerase-like protein
MMMMMMSEALPPLSPHRTEMFTSYGLHFGDGDYPLRRMPDGSVSEHPLYGVYAVDDYLSQHQQTGDQRFLDAAKRVAVAGVDRMDETLDGGLAFFYERDGRRFYSGLTQSRWFDVLCRLGDPAVSPAPVLKSLLVSVKDGGVLRGYVIEEWPETEPTLILNGWITALKLLAAHSDHWGSWDGEYFVFGSLCTMGAYLPRYDCPEAANTYYGLGGRFHRLCGWTQNIGGRHYNIYHYHAIRGMRTMSGLAQTYAPLLSDWFLQYHKRWLAYTVDWPRLYPGRETGEYNPQHDPYDA